MKLMNFLRYVKSADAVTMSKSDVDLLTKVNIEPHRRRIQWTPTDPDNLCLCLQSSSDFDRKLCCELSSLIKTILPEPHFSFLLSNYNLSYEWSGGTRVVLFGAGLSHISRRNPPVEIYRSKPARRRRRRIYDPNYVIHKKVFHQPFKSGRALLINRDFESVHSALTLQSELKMTKPQIRALKHIIKSKTTVQSLRCILNQHIPKNDIFVPNNKVSEIVLHIMNELLPHQLISSNPKDFLQFQKNVKIILGRHPREAVRLRDILKRIHVVNPVKCTILIWIFKTFVVKVIVCLFWISQCVKSHVSKYYKANKWKYIRAVWTKNMINNGQLTCRLDMSYLDSQVSTMRVLPKSQGLSCRPIITNSIQRKMEEELLKACRTLLAQLHYQKKGSSNVFSNLHNLWLNFVRKTKFNDYIYFVKCDVKDAFGSVKHDLLIEIVEREISHLKSDFLTYENFGYAGLFGTEIKVGQFTDLPSSLTNKKLTLGGGSRKLDVRLLKRFIVEYVDGTFIALGRDRIVYQLTKGLPQGGVLSSILCEIYYYELDQKCLRDLNRTDEGDVMLRAVDDYLFVTKNKERAQIFLSRIHAGFPEFGVEMQSEKTLTNLNSNITSVPYYGLIITPEKRLIKPDVKSDSSTDRAKHQHRWSVLFFKLKFVQTLKLRPLVLDPTYLPKREILHNVFIASSSHAIKYKRTFRSLRRRGIGECHTDYLLKCILNSVDMIAYRCASLSQLSSRLMKYCVIRSFISILRDDPVHSDVVNRLQTQSATFKIGFKSREKKLAEQVTKKKNLPDFLLNEL